MEKYCKFNILNPREIEILEIYNPIYKDARISYKIGDKLGPYNSILLERIYQKGHSYGKFKCSYCDNYFIARIDAVAKGQIQSCGCKLEKTYLERRTDLTGQRYEKLVAIKDIGTKNNNRLWLCQCDCGRTTTIVASNWKNIASCGHCNLSKGENKIEEILQNNNITFERQKTFDSCRNINLLRFDFYLPDYNILIEYDGIQHFSYRENSDWNTKENYEKTITNDKIKNKWCLDNSKMLIRIPYTYFENIKLEDLLTNSQFLIKEE